MLKIEGLTVPGVAPFDIELAAGACASLSGASGSGKSLLLRAIADLDPRPGRVILDGVAWHDVPAPRWRSRVAYLAAESGWWSDFVGDHFARRDAVAGSLPRLGLPPGILDQPVARLSTGERQRLALLRALEISPRVMLLDEPTGALDGDSVRAVETMLTERLAVGMLAIVVTHDADQAARLAGRRFRIEDSAVTEIES